MFPLHVFHMLFHLMFHNINIHVYISIKGSNIYVKDILQYIVLFIYNYL